MDRDELIELYQAATGNRKDHGAQEWAAATLGVTTRTVRNWLTGATSPGRLELARLRVRAAVQERARAIAAERRAGRGWFRRARAALRGFDRAVLAELERERREYDEALARDPGRFADVADWAAHARRVTGRRPTRAQMDAAERRIVPPGGRGHEDYQALPWLAQRRRLWW